MSPICIVENGFCKYHQLFTQIRNTMVSFPNIFALLAYRAIKAKFTISLELRHNAFTYTDKIG